MPLTQEPTVSTVQAAEQMFLTRREAEVIIEQGEARYSTAAEAHQQQHEAERQLIDARFQTILVQDEGHRLTHDKEHNAHEKIHTVEQAEVQTALNAVSKEREIHALAHTREHGAHEVRHEDAKEARDKAESSIDKRLVDLNGLQALLREQSTTFITRAQWEDKNTEREKRIDSLNADMTRRFDEQRLAITAIEKGDVKQEGKSLGQGMVAAIIVGAVSFISIVLGIIVIVANILTAKSI